MAEPLPLTTFNFLVKITVYSDSNWVIDAGFSECDGLQMEMSYKPVYEGGSNHRPVMLPDKLSYGRLSLRRGMTESQDLWRWFEAAQSFIARKKKVLTADVQVQVLSSDRTRSATFQLSGCFPVKIKAPGLNALNGQVAIEELEVAYESLFRDS